MTLPTFTYENSCTGLVAGVDEAGCGPWAGPVVAGAFVFLDPQAASLFPGLKDSKQMTALRREAMFHLFERYQGTGISFAWGLASVQEVDALNIRQAALLAMERAVEALPVTPNHVLVDGNRPPALGIPFTLIVKGDQHSLSIAAASVVAKVTRDRLMQQLHQEYPDYGWNKNAGYGTKAHQEALACHGPTMHHRRTFSPIAALLQRGLR